MIRSDKPVTLLGAGRVDRRALQAALKRAPFLVAADGGANKAFAEGLAPEFVIGDMDSIGPEVLADLSRERLIRVAEQETTDFEKCLIRIVAPYILAVGFSGDRQDHVLAVWNALARNPSRRCLVIGSQDVVFLAPRRLRLDLHRDTRVSLFPIAPVRGRSKGLEWPIDGIDFAPDGRVGTSNRATGPVELDFDSERMLVLLPPECLDAAIRALATTDHGASSLRNKVSR
ncbi:thiamine diphosphokinase [Albidovulum inexpectatum]|uniref:thiamine diphosphokinase n=1 Tax=Albidovulum inexpectatum TaxID=196587 RepID=UPI003184443B